MQPYSLGFETNRQAPKIGVVYAAFVGRMKGLYTGPPRRFRELVVYAKYTFAGKTTDSEKIGEPPKVPAAHKCPKIW